MDAEAVVGKQACAVDFLMEAETAMIAGGTCDKRTALQSQTQRAAMNDAVRCDGRCTALRHFTRAIPMRQEGPNNRTPQPPIGLQRPHLSYPSIPSEPCLIPQKHLLCRLLGTDRQTVKRNTRNSKTGRSEPRGRTMKDVRQDGAAQRIERKTTDVGRKHEWQALLRLPLEYLTMQVRS